MFTWNYRVIKTIDKLGYEVYQIHEVYYDADRKTITGWTGSSQPLGESLAELQQDMEFMMQALSRPILNSEDLDEVESSNKQEEME